MTKTNKILIIGTCGVVFISEGALLAGVFFGGDITAVIFSAIMLALFALLAVYLAGPYLAVPDSAKAAPSPFADLAAKIKNLTGTDPGPLKENPAGYIEQEFVNTKKGLDKYRALVSSSLNKTYEPLLKATTNNDLVRALAKIMGALELIDAAVVLFVNKEKKSAVLYPVFPDKVAQRKEFVIGEGGLSLDKIQIVSPVYREQLSGVTEPSELEAIFKEGGHSASLSVAVTSGEVFLGLLGVAAKEQKSALLKANYSPIEDVAAMLGLKLGVMNLSAALEEKKNEVYNLKHEGKDEVKKQLKDMQQSHAQVVQEQKMASLGQLSAGVAHELNNPIGGIVGYVQLIVSKMKKPEVTKEDIASSLKHLELVEKESKRCQWIISNLLNFARKPQDERASLDIKEVVDNTVSMMGYQAEKSNCKISVSFPPEGLKKISGNTNELQQVFTNLVKNAMDAMPEGGEITVTGKNMDGYIIVTVSDSGMGISKENLSRIFEPFYTSKLGQAGTGLGLSITYTIISSHNGVLSVDSEEGKGTTFTIKLPAIKES